jgi:N-acetylglucosamine kinase-like BadF-type ATPase
VKFFLGVDGGGTKTDFLLIDEDGRELATHRGGSAYYLETGLEAPETLLAGGITATLQAAGLTAEQLTYSFIGLPAHGEDSGLAPRLDALAASVLPAARFRCGNDMVCGWAGALAGRDGINLVAGTGSIAYGEWAARTARAGGWGELFSDEGSAYWVAREALALFSRMSDGRAGKGPLYELVRHRFGLQGDLDLCAAIYGPPALARSELAALAPLVTRAAADGDPAAQQLIVRAAAELATLVHAVRNALEVPPQALLPVSYSGGMFALGEILLGPLRDALEAAEPPYEFVVPKLTTAAGAALNVARLGGAPLSSAAIAQLSRHCEADAFWRSDRRYLATSESQAVTAINAEVRGLALPRVVINKVYWGNARRAFGLARTGTESRARSNP